MLETLNAGVWSSPLELNEFPEPEVVKLRHPVLLCHGYGAIAGLVKPSPLYDVAMLMRSHNVLAFAPNIVPYAKIATRAERWIPIIDKIVAEGETKKLNIVAHSMGGLDIRYALSKLDAALSVASFTMISTPNRGTCLAELALKTPGSDKVGNFLDWMGERFYPATTSNAIASAEQLTRQYITEYFNHEVPDVAGIPYYSYSSAVGKQTEQPVKVLSRYQNNYIFEQEGINDGMVSVKSAKWGQHIKTGNLSHLELMNLRMKDERKPLFKKFWLEVIKMLQEKGH